MENLLYIHIGPVVPDYLYDSIYQSLLINHTKASIYILVDDSQVNAVQNRIASFDFDRYTKEPFAFLENVYVIGANVIVERLKENVQFANYTSALQKFGDLSSFRNGFWVSTTARFFYLWAFMQLYNISDIFHMENDNMLYVPLSEVKERHVSQANCIWMVEDAPNRVVPSFLFFPSVKSAEALCTFISKTISTSSRFINDMDILGMYGDKKSFPIFPNDSGLVFDGAAIGQYLGGVDPANLPDKNALTIYNNPSVGFINETSIMKPNRYNFAKRPVFFDHLTCPLHVYVVVDGKKIHRIVNLHIHCKVLAQFSSVIGFKFGDIISGDRVCGLADYVIATREILNFHKNLQYFAKDVISIKDPNFIQIDADALNNYLKAKGTDVKLFIYTHILDKFVTHVLPKLSKDLRVTYYTHNSDHSFDSSYETLLNHPTTKRIFCQNVDIPLHEKIKLLPIGIANSMWPHGDLVALYSVIMSTYTAKKTKGLYVNINPDTFGYRGHVLSTLKSNNFQIASSKKYAEYLADLAQHRFCLCIRGNGIDTHRFWESLYLGVVPVVIDNDQTNITQFNQYLSEMEVPFYCPKSDVSTWKESDFGTELYKSFNKKSILNTEHLKLSAYGKF